MSYVRANTAPSFGMRSQALSPMASRLGYYFRSGFPLPTTSLSRPIRLGNPGGAFYDGPDNVYPQPEHSPTRDTATPQLSGEWVPPQPPGRALFQQGAVTYRINPQTGQYEFHSTDLLPRGLWQQNTFQHPPRPALSSLGVPVSAHGVSLVQAHGRNIVMRTAPGRRAHRKPAGLFGLGCNCGGHCSCKGLGDLPTGTQLQPYGVDAQNHPVFRDPNTGDIYDMDGNPMDDQSGVTTIEAMRNAGVLPATSGSSAQQTAAALTQAGASIVQAVNSPHPLLAQSAPTFGGSTMIAGQAIPNMLLYAGAALALLTIGRGGKRR